MSEEQHDALHMALFPDMNYMSHTSSEAKLDTITVESMIENVEKIQREWEQERLPRPELRANRKTIDLIGHELAKRTPVSRLPTNGDLPPIGTPAQLSTLYGMTIEIDESLSDGEVRPARPKPRCYSVMDLFKESTREGYR